MDVGLGRLVAVAMLGHAVLSSWMAAGELGSTAEQQAELLSFTVLLHRRISKEKLSSLKKKILMKWHSVPTYIAVGSAPSVRDPETHRYRSRYT